MTTFVVRLFVPIEPGAGVPEDSLQGVVEEIGSARRANFSSADELLAFLVAAKTERGTQLSGRSSP